MRKKKNLVLKHIYDTTGKMVEGTRLQKVPNRERCETAGSETYPICSQNFGSSLKCKGIWNATGSHSEG